MTAITWVLAADGNRALIFETRGLKVDLQQVEDIRNPASRMLESSEKFARTIANFLDRSHVQHRFDRLKLAVDPGFVGVLRECLNTETRELLYEESSNSNASGMRRTL
ncbi:hypothetical protein BPMI_01349 [Candidatus Burkholderia pumila]|uniref:Uncharacterized protein n=1 Tax=Candidatus Burkholderia pumila TaxID=1090375 RepID=A0ABR5HKJ5_9BURK|nr:hypothetical protein BPMI_01349 [Candidatus Burkholderia pumila]